MTDEPWHLQVRETLDENLRNEIMLALHKKCEDRWDEKERRIPGIAQTIHFADAHREEAEVIFESIRGIIDRAVVKLKEHHESE